MGESLIALPEFMEPLIESASGSELVIFSKELFQTLQMVRQLLEKSLPYYVLYLIVVFEGEWIEGARSEYNWAGHLLFKGLLGQTTWASGVEKLTSEELRQKAIKFASNNKNFLKISLRFAILNIIHSIILLYLKLSI